MGITGKLLRGHVTLNKILFDQRMLKLFIVKILQHSQNRFYKVKDNQVVPKEYIIPFYCVLSTTIIEGIIILYNSHECILPLSISIMLVVLLTHESRRARKWRSCCSLGSQFPLPSTQILFFDENRTWEIFTSVG